MFSLNIWSWKEEGEDGVTYFKGAQDKTWGSRLIPMTYFYKKSCKGGPLYSSMHLLRVNDDDKSLGQGRGLTQETRKANKEGQKSE